MGIIFESTKKHCPKCGKTTKHKKQTGKTPSRADNKPAPAPVSWKCKKCGNIQD